MKKIILSSIVSVMVLNANSDIYLNTGTKDYSNSKTKIDGKTNTVGVSHKYQNVKINLNYTKDEVNREHPMTKASMESLDVKKYNLNFEYNLDDKFSLKTNYIKIIDNLAPTDQGKIYGLGAKYNIITGLGLKLDFYRSDYDTFNVNQYDMALYKGFKIKEIKSKLTLIAKKIKIDGNKYGSYTFKDKDYLTTGIKINSSYKGFVAGIGAFFGKRAFTVLKDGTKVQHHAMEQDETYMASIGKKFQNFNLIASYSYQNGKELPENQEDVDTKVTSLMLKYKF
ncbi:MAG: hypothetical protein U9O56_05000 [Campylobacterota bacterium]|nr:hypothetical protein [Campylobacterota bacterium]